MRTENLRLDSERDELKVKVGELEGQLGELYQRNRDLQLDNDEIPILRDSVEEMKYLESKVVSLTHVPKGPPFGPHTHYRSFTVFL